MESRIGVACSLVWVLLSIMARRGQCGTISCTGTRLDCESQPSGLLSCHITFSKDPFCPTVCYIKDACIENGNVEFYDDSPFGKAFDGVPITTMTLVEDTGSRGWWSKGSVTLKAMPAHNFQRTNNTISHPVVYIWNTENDNYGQTMGDDIWAIYQMVHTYAIEHEDFEVALHGRDFPRPVGAKLFSAISNFPLRYHRGERLCVDRLYIGSNGLDYSDFRIHSHTLVKFRDFVVAKLGLSHHPLPRAIPNIVLILKDPAHADNKKSLISNVDDVITTIKSAIPGASVVTRMWGGMSVHDQVESMIQADITLSLAGTDLMNAIFMPIGSTIISICRYVEVMEKSNEARIWFSAMPELRVFEICKQSDITFGGKEYDDKPNCAQTERGKLCGKPTNVNVKTLRGYIKGAAKDWSQRRIGKFQMILSEGQLENNDKKVKIMQDLIQVTTEFSKRLDD